jgi:hypothetical protein
MVSAKSPTIKTSAALHFAKMTHPGEPTGVDSSFLRDRQQK